MSDIAMITKAFDIVEQPVIVTCCEQIIYMNCAAVKLANSDFTGKPASRLLPGHILNTQAGCFAASAFIGTKNCTVRVSTQEDYRFYVMNYSEVKISDYEMLFTNVRSTLSNIKFASTCISVLAENEGNAQLKEYACSLNRSYYRIKRTLENVTALTALSSGSMVFRPELTDLTKEAEKLIEAVIDLMSDNDISISLRADEAVKCVVDPALFSQLLLNLVSNSVFHCARGGKISVSLYQSGKNIVLSVDDNGEGIAPDELAMVYERYRHEIDLTKSPGSGMGLAVCRGIAELHNGAIIIESRGSGKGTSVRVMLSSELKAAAGLSSHKAEYGDARTRMILMELSSCLPVSCYSELYED